ncbi:hypothetical protein BBF96_08740 [Anoxybacter fermentans]|uniref:Uncharacterized protein n=1 Tax=Anoxybacter fermentans TaxID=1323375 RepID=A0A3S9SYT5_9FIRM|nr:hypothetical protein BBF96_08740 [Anoxybacter fermentans]
MILEDSSSIDSISEEDLGVSAYSSQVIAFSVLGLYLLGHAIPMIPNYIFLIYNSWKEEDDISSIVNISMLIKVATQLILGLYFFFY